MSPTQFERGCLPNWKALVKLVHIAQVGGIKVFTQLLGVLGMLPISAQANEATWQALEDGYL